MRAFRTLSLILILAGGCLTGSTGQTPGTNLSGTQPSPREPTNVVRSFVARGLIQELPAGGQTVIVRHEAIPGFMPKMTMEFNVRDTNELRGLAPGQAITFCVRATETESWIEGIQRTNTSDSLRGPPADPPSSVLLYATRLKEGDVLPDVGLLAEDGRNIRLSDFHGRAVALTFLFTRCPFPDFCPRMNQHFQHAREMLLQLSTGPTNWQFLSISFDPEFDQPGVLTRYASAYRGSLADRWLFAAAPNQALASMSPRIDFRFSTEGGSFVHNLRTVVLDPQGRIYRQFDGNRWKPEDLARAIAEAANIPSHKDQL